VRLPIIIFGHLVAKMVACGSSRVVRPNDGEWVHSWAVEWTVATGPGSVVSTRVFINEVAALRMHRFWMQ